MAVPFELAVAVAVVGVVASTWLALRGRLSAHTLRAASALLLVLAAASLAVAAVWLASDRGDWRAAAVSAGALALAGLAELATIGLVRWLDHLRTLEDGNARAMQRLDAALATHAASRAAELERTLTTERAETGHLLLEQERRLGEERRAELEEQLEHARSELARAVTEAQDRLAGRIATWSADLERNQRDIKTRLDQFAERQNVTFEAQEARLSAHAAELESITAVQHGAAERLRADFAHQLAEAFAETHAEIEAQAGEQRRVLAELTERLRGQSRSLREDADREEVDARTRLAAALPEVERRVVEQLQRSLDRATDRLVEDAERRFDAQLKQSREDTAGRLARELDKNLEFFSRQAEKDVAARMTEVAQSTARRLQRQLDEVVRAAEAQTSVSEERIAFLTGRFDKAVEDAAGRLAAFEADLELELSTKLAEFERSFRHAEQAVGRETA